MNKKSGFSVIIEALSHRVMWIMLLFLVSNAKGYAQFYTTGVDPASIKWNQLKTDTHRVIFPNYYEDKARIVEGYLDYLTPYVTHSMSAEVEKFNVILHTENIQSNGLVSWAPKRMELFMPPPSAQNSLPWIKQLVAHEYRHVVQMSNLDVGITRILKYVLGEQIVGLVASIPPLWYFEGDAVFVETQFAFNGRGSQPSFSMGMRALLNEDLKVNTRLYDKWNLGSYKEYTPSYYEFGYFMTAYTYKKYGDDYWNNILRYVGRNPYFVVSDYIAARKYYNTSSVKVFKETLAELKDFWHEESQKPNSTSILQLPYKSYTIYKDAQYLGNETIVARKYSLDEVYGIVAVDKVNNTELRLKSVPLSDNRLVIKDSVAYWNEYAPSLFYDNDVKSVIKKADFYTKNGQLKMRRAKTIKLNYPNQPILNNKGEEVIKSDNYDFVTPISDDKFALVVYDKQNNPSIDIFDKEWNFEKTYSFDGDDDSILGLAFDEETSNLAYIIVDDRGMTIEAIDLETSEKEIVHNSTYIVFSDLSAQNGKLYFGSTESGKDEVHVINLVTQKQYQLTSSKYGSFAGVGGSDSQVALATYTTKGYKLAEQKFDIDTLRKVSLDKKMPKKTVAVPTVDWNLPKLDTINITASSVDKNEGKLKKYNKTSHLFNIHSWVPAVVNVDKLINDQQLEMGYGATLLTQNSLSSLTGYFGYGWVPKTEKSLFIANLEYSALPVHVGLGMSYGGDTQDLFSTLSADELLYQEIEMPEVKNKLDLDLNLSLPMSFSGNSSARALQPYVNLSLTNALLFDDTFAWTKHYDAKVKYGVSYTAYQIMAKKDVAPRLGYSLLAGGTVNPFRDDFGSILNFYAKGYLPGLFQHHALSVAGAYQVQTVSKYNYVQEFMFPRGNDLQAPVKDYVSTAVSYKMPIVNSDFIIPSIVDIKRIYLDIFGEYAKCNYINDSYVYDKKVHSYGAELFFDTLFLGMRTIELNIGLSVYKASQHEKPQVGFGVSINY
ncbi:MAG: hypothetical protein R3Y26_00270 [Rikenellaceae bacterium]